LTSPLNQIASRGWRFRRTNSNHIPGGTTLTEEKKTDETLSKLAESGVNQHAQAA